MSDCGIPRWRYAFGVPRVQQITSQSFSPVRALPSRRHREISQQLWGRGGDEWISGGVGSPTTVL